MITVYREDLITEICRDTGYTRHVVRAIWDSMVSNVILSVSKGNRVVLTGLGTFVPQKRAPRTGRNIHTGQPVPIPARIIPKFIPGEWLKTAAYEGAKKGGIE